MARFFLGLFRNFHTVTTLFSWHNTHTSHLFSLCKCQAIRGRVCRALPRWGNNWAHSSHEDIWSKSHPVRTRLFHQRRYGGAFVPIMNTWIEARAQSRPEIELHHWAATDVRFVPWIFMRGTLTVFLPVLLQPNKSKAFKSTHYHVHFGDAQTV